MGTTKGKKPNKKLKDLAAKPAKGVVRGGAKATTKLMEACATGKHLPAATIE
jgi:hypothetical protein